MDPVTGAMLISAAAPVVTGLIGGQQASRDRNRSMSLLEELYRNIKGINTPSVKEQEVNLERLAKQGDLNLRGIEASQVGTRDQLQDINLDPRLRQMKMQELDAVSKLGSTAFTAEERAQYNAMRRDAEADNASRIRSLLEGQQARGVASSDAALMSQLQATQSGANRQAEQADRSAAMASSRKLQAMREAGQLAGSFEQADYARAAEIAQALRNREFTNVGYQSQTKASNMDTFNKGLTQNWMENQRIADSNTNLGNQQQMHNKALIQQKFQNELAKAQAAMGAGGNLAQGFQNRGDSTAASWAAGGSAIASGAGAYSQYLQNQELMKRLYPTKEEKSNKIYQDTVDWSQA